MPKDFSFNNDDRFKKVVTAKKASRGLPALLIKWRVVQNEQQANTVLILFIFIAVCAILYINMSTFSSAPLIPEDPSLTTDSN